MTNSTVSNKIKSGKTGHRVLQSKTDGNVKGEVMKKLYMDPEAEIIEIDASVRTALVNSGEGDEENIPTIGVGDIFGND